MPVKINNNAITPAPLVTMGKTFVTTPASGVIGANYSITLAGDLLTLKGNPEPEGFSESGYYTTYSPDDEPSLSSEPSGWLQTVMKKQEYLRNILTSGNQNVTYLEIIGFDDSRGIKAYCDIESISFDDKSRWTTGCGYNITLSCRNFAEAANSGLFPDHMSEDNFQYYVSEADESWTINENDSYGVSSGNIYEQNKLYTISHSVSAVGQRAFQSDGGFASGLTPVEQASGYVHNVIGIGLTTNTDLPSYLGISTFLDQGFGVNGRKVTENINKWTGSYGIEEEFTVFKSGQAAVETVEISVEKDLSPFTRVSINGSINGFNTNSPTSSTVNKWVNASGYWDVVEGLIYNRVSDYAPSGTSINATALSSSVGRNLEAGVITYNYSYDNRPSNTLTNSLTEDIQINDTYPGQIINVVPVIGRSQPVIQYVNSRSEYKRALSINAVMDMDPSTGSPYRPSDADLSGIFVTYAPTGEYTYYGPPQENWSPRTGSYSYSIEWTFKGPGSNAGTGFDRRA